MERDVGRFDLFPLRLRASTADAGHSRQLPRYLRRRLLAKSVEDDLLQEVVMSLNSLHGSRANGQLPRGAAQRASKEDGVGRMHHAVLSRICKKIQRTLPRPVEADWYPDGALCVLLR